MDKTYPGMKLWWWALHNCLGKPIGGWLLRDAGDHYVILEPVGLAGTRVIKMSDECDLIPVTFAG
jgi:hypothetical protein